MSVIELKACHTKRHLCLAGRQRRYSRGNESAVAPNDRALLGYLKLERRDELRENRFCNEDGWISSLCISTTREALTHFQQRELEATKVRDQQREGVPGRS